MRQLIVTEKFNAAVRIATILSDGKARRSHAEGATVFEWSKGDDRYQVVGLRGHIINLDYPESLNDWAHVDLRDLIWADPQKVVTAGKIAAALKTLGGAGAVLGSALYSGKIDLGKAMELCRGGRGRKPRSKPDPRAFSPSAFP